MKFKKTMSGVIASALTMTVGIILQMTVSAEYTGLKYDDYLYYMKIDMDKDEVYDYVEITDCDETATEVDIPAEIDSLPVISIGDSAFWGCENLEKIICPDSVEYLGVNALAETGITDIKLSKNLKSIDYQCFWGCENLESIDLPDSLEYIGAWTFRECISLKEIVIPNRVTSIPEGVFNDCESLTNITIPNSVTNIGEGVFYNTPWLEAKRAENPLVIVSSILIDGKTCSGNIEIPDGVTSIVKAAFSNCGNLTSVTIPSSVTSIGTYAFSGTALLESQTGVKYVNTWVVDCDEDITSAEIKEGTKGIGNDAFFSCENLTEVIIPDSVEIIGNGAFSDCTSLKSVSVPNNVKSIGEWAFSDCTSRESIRILNPDCEIYDSNNTISNDYDDNYNRYFNGTIYGYENSTAQAYAEKYGYKFESLGEYTPSWSVADIIALQNYLVKKTNSIGSYYDLNNDGKLNVFDLIILKRKVIYG